MDGWHGVSAEGRRGKREDKSVVYASLNVRRQWDKVWNRSLTGGRSRRLGIALELAPRNPRLCFHTYSLSSCRQSDRLYGGEQKKLRVVIVSYVEHEQHRDNQTNKGLARVGDDVGFFPGTCHHHRKVRARPLAGRDGAHLGQVRTDSPVLLRAVCGGEHDRGLGVVRVGNPRLRAVQHPLIPVEPCSRSGRACSAKRKTVRTIDRFNLHSVRPSSTSRH